MKTGRYIQKKIAIKAGDTDFGQLKELAVDILGAKPVVDLEGVSAFTFTDGTLLELYNSCGNFPEYLFEGGRITVSFRVSDIVRSRDQALKKGFEALTDIIDVCASLRYCHLRSASGVVVGLYEDSKTDLPSGRAIV